MGLALPTEVGRLLAGEGDDLRLDRRVVEPRRRMMRAVHQARKALGDEPAPPVLRGMADDSQPSRDRGVAGPGGGQQNDPRPQCGLLAARARPNTPLQFVALGDGQLDRRGMASHDVPSWERPPLSINQAYAQHSFRSNLKRMD
jgi:hypothetical protein